MLHLPVQLFVFVAFLGWTTVGGIIGIVVPFRLSVFCDKTMLYYLVVI